MSAAQPPDELFGVASALLRMRAMPAHHNNHSLNRMEVESLLRWFDTHSAVHAAISSISTDTNPERFRREAPSIDGTPLREGIDYATAGNMVDRAMHHLDEGLPLGQRVRCRLAYGLLAQGVEALGQWMRAKGYFEDPPTAT